MSKNTQKDSETFEEIQELLLELGVMSEYGSKSVDIQYIIDKLEALRGTFLRETLNTKL